MINIKVDDLYVREDKTIVLRFRCTKCDLHKVIDDFGVRTMASGEIRKQAQCRKCRANRSRSKSKKVLIIEKSILTGVPD